MYVGHLAIGLAMKAYAPKTPAAPIMLGVGLLDIVDGLLIMAGVDHVSPNLDAGPYLFFDLVFIDWDHSLLMAALLSLLWGAAFWRRKTVGVAIIAACAAFSHWLADLPMHNLDLALFPHSETHFGYGLWGTLQTGSWVLEGVFSAILVVIAWLKFRSRGVSMLWPTIMLALLFIQLSPWFSPMKMAAGLGNPADYLAHGALVTLGFLVPGLLLSWLVTRSERLATQRTPLLAAE